ncbi:MAG: HAD-IIB family hydrolase [Maritimibacter sp.]
MTKAAALPLLVFSDLDGTLLDHDTYSFEPARPILRRLADMGAGVILATSKTAAEVAPLRAKMALEDWPAIVENGAGLLPEGTALSPQNPIYEDLREALTTLPHGVRALFVGFGDMQAEEVSAATGLSLEDAHLAKQRCFSEPGLFTGNALQEADFLAALAPHGIQARRGGRFLTLSFGATKADQMETLISRFAPSRTIAIGDAPNDIEMLERADLGILIPNPHAPDIPQLLGETNGTVRRAPSPGPTGWAAMMGDIITKFETS